MQSRVRWIYWVVVVLLMLPFVASAQTSSVNAYSPYSMYGPGELLTPGSVQMRSMGGVGIAVRSMGQVNLLNPAAASVAPRKSFLFDVGFDGTHYRNRQSKYNGENYAGRARTAYNTVNIHSLALTFPLAKGLGVSFGVAPYSSVGYKIKTTDQSEDAWADVGRVMYGYSGDGDITEVKLSVGWEPWRNFSIGVAAKYFWGNIERNYSAEIVNDITGSGSIASTTGLDRYSVSNFKFQVGVQWNILYSETQLFTLGATYDLGGSLKPKKHSYVYTDNTINSIQSNPVRDNIEVMELQVPHQFGVGLFYRNRTMACGLDYNYAMWGDANKGYNENANLKNLPVTYTRTHDIKLGFEYTPRSTDVRNYLNRISYRFGVRLGNYYQRFAGERLNKMAVTAGLGLPIKVWGASSVNIGFEYGRMMPASQPTYYGGERVGLVKQNYYKVTLGFSLFSVDTSDYWFVRQKYD